MLLKQHELEVDRLRTQFANDRSVRPISGFDLFIRRTAHQVCRFSCQIVGVAIMSFVLTGAVGAALTSQAVAGETISKIERKVIERIPIPGTDEELQMMLVIFPPGARSEPHVHPVQGMNYIIEGTAESQYEGHPLEVLKAGDSYLDLASVTHTLFRNPSQTDPLKFVIAYKIKKDVSFLRPLRPQP